MPNGDGWTMNATWGKSSEDFYVVGNHGMIAHYNGHSWTKIESGTDLPIQDIWGSKDERTGEYEILCVASDSYYNHGKKLLKIKNNTAEEINSEGLSWSLEGLWFIANRKYVIVGAGYYSSVNYNKTWKETAGLPNIYMEAVAANGINDIFVCGDFGLLSHFNGSSWKHFYKYTQGVNKAIDVKDNTIICLSRDQRKAYIIHGKR